MDELPGESLVKPLPRKLLYDYGCHAEMRWKVVAYQGYKIPNPNNLFYMCSRGPPLT